MEIAKALEARVTHAIRMRYCTELKATHRIRFRDRIFHIHAVTTFEERSWETVVLAEEQVGG